MRKGQFFFNYLRPFFKNGGIENPYNNCHFVFFNLSDEYWEIMEDDYKKFMDGKPFNFPTNPFDGRLCSPEHEKALGKSIRDILNENKS